MDESEIKIKSEEPKEIKFSRKFKILLGTAIFITGLLGICGTSFILIMGIKEKVWLENGTNWFVSMSLFYMTIFIIFIALVKIAKSRRPFSSVVFRCMMIIGVMHIIASIAAPWIPGFRHSGFELLSITSKLWIEGSTFLIGILFVVLGKILEYGFYYQQESDETL